MLANYLYVQRNLTSSRREVKPLTPSASSSNPSIAPSPTRTQISEWRASQWRFRSRGLRSVELSLKMPQQSHYFGLFRLVISPYSGILKARNFFIYGRQNNG